MNKLIKTYTVLLAMLTSCLAYAQTDLVETNDGDLTIIPINHATLAIQWKNEVIYFDPSGDKTFFNELPKPTLILITDIHGDHYNLKTIQHLHTPNVPIVAPEAVADMMPDSFKNVKTLDNFKKMELLGMTIEAIPMYNLPETADSRHPKGRGNGYILTVGGKRIYVCGDTEDIKEMRELKNIDIAFICMNQPYTMEVEAAASAVLDFEPKVVYPFHFRGQGGFSDVDKFKSLVEEKNKKIEVRLREWYK